MLENELSTRRRRSGRVARSVSRVMAAGLVVAIAGGLDGPALRDRSVATALLLRIESCTLFNGPYTDHRGQVVRILESEQ
jgi:hypothetical protein